MIATGVASPSAHGHATTSTATAVISAATAHEPCQQPAHEGDRGDDQDDRDEHRRDPVGEPLGFRLLLLGCVNRIHDLA
jgi:hypothetical protein